MNFFILTFLATAVWAESVTSLVSPSTWAFYAKINGRLTPLTNRKFPTLNYLALNPTSSQNPRFSYTNDVVALWDTENPEYFGIVNEHLSYGKDVKFPFKLKLNKDYKVINLQPYLCQYKYSIRGFFMTRNYTTSVVTCSPKDIYLKPLSKQDHRDTKQTTPEI